jgi:hypothetical protein
VTGHHLPWRLLHKLYYFLELPNFFYKKILQEQNSAEENEEPVGIFRNILKFDMESSKLINYLAGMCWSPCTMAL